MKRWKEISPSPTPPSCPPPFKDQDKNPAYTMPLLLFHLLSAAAAAAAARTSASSYAIQFQFGRGQLAFFLPHP